MTEEEYKAKLQPYLDDLASSISTMIEQKMIDLIKNWKDAAGLQMYINPMKEFQPVFEQLFGKRETTNAIIAWIN